MRSRETTPAIGETAGPVGEAGRPVAETGRYEAAGRHAASSYGEGSREEGHGYGLVLFASFLLIVIGCFNLIYGIAAVINSHVFVATTNYVVGDLRAWGWTTLVLGALQLIAAVGVLVGNQVARWVAAGLVSLSAIEQMLFLPAFPLWSLAIIAMDVVALYGLVAYGSRENIAAA
ncbi:MAG TPA: hypothetical protein VGS19_08280 [Streptosporangiaceae bacterium]|nr:hypothetical protein [Streptosporangiaceae bacterium]